MRCWSVRGKRDFSGSELGHISGARSAQATVLLQKSGFSQVANLTGGMLRWRAEGMGMEAGAQD